MPFRAADPFWSAATRRRFYVSTKASVEIPKRRRVAALQMEIPKRRRVAALQMIASTQGIV